MTDFDDPASRLALIERVGPDEYNRQLRAHLAKSPVVNGYPIVPQQTRFGQLFAVMGTNFAFRTLAEAESFARSQTPRPGEIQ